MSCQILCISQLIDYDGFFYNESVCSVPHSSHFNYTVISTSIAVCIKLCNDSSFYDMVCSGFFWFRTNNSCLLTSFTGDNEISNCTETNHNIETMFFRRIRPLCKYINKIRFVTYEDNNKYSQ